ncbi:MAG: DUF1223 domain-containing protein [Rhodospirillaceae bacterium]
MIPVTGAGVARAGENPVVVELSTPQSCYSCPPAEQYLGELSARPGVVALEWHVDYWDTLVYGFHGKWKDPFSSPEHTRRQPVYNVSICKRSGVYTPQMAIAGHIEETGTRDTVINTHIGRLKSQPKLTVAISGGPRPKVTVTGNAGAGSEVLLVQFINEAVTRVPSGENHGKTLKSHHIVQDMSKLAEWRGTDAGFNLPADAIGDNRGCAVLVQERNQGRIIGADLCPNGAGIS